MCIHIVTMNQNYNHVGVSYGTFDFDMICDVGGAVAPPYTAYSLFGVIRLFFQTSIWRPYIMLAV